MATQPTILLVTDEPYLLDALALLLRRGGYSVLIAPDGDRAVELLLRQLPDLAVLDMLLPGRSGFQITRLLKEQSDRRVPVVMISALTAAPHRDYAFAAGVDWFLEKWLTPSRLLEVVRALCPVPEDARRPGSGSIPQPAGAPA
jgi:DNA-binding response OmpR family regulator